ncbi:MAG TPA: 2Fe-2S iron-sulfur cluster-binding protein [Gaiellaceae bacterium]|nr:2Fe-2S iron-sulfur cluster-binding protein [Gaiellaceae bacterium]
MTRLAPQPGERLDRSRELSFSFRGGQVAAFPGDTFGSALYASGQRIFSRSFKYHRPRGLLCCSGGCANCMMTVDGTPNVRVCVEPVRDGATVEPQNVLGSLDRDLLSVVDRVGGLFTPVGFYYRTMIRPRRLWPYYEKFLRNVAGLGRVDKHRGRAGRYDTEHRTVDVLVVGGGRSGLRAARDAAQRGEDVLVVDENQPREEQADGFELIAPARAIGVYEGGLVPVDAGSLLLHIRAKRIVVATGTIEQPLVFPGNDLVGVMLPGGVRRLVREFAVKPGGRAVVLAGDDRALECVADLRAAGVDVLQLVDLRERGPAEISASGRRGRLESVSIDGTRFDCDLLIASGSPQPAYSLLAQAGATVAYDASRGIFVPTEPPPGFETVGRVTGAVGPVGVPHASYGGERGGKCFVCTCEDVTEKDLKRALAEGFDSLELAKRYTTVTMGPCQGRLCHLASIRLHAREQELDPAAIGTTTARPPWAPVKLGLLAGRAHEPAKRTSIHHRHREAGATMMWTGDWRRPYSYVDPQAEASNVHDAVGVIDVSTLGKLLVLGGDAAAFLERLYPNRFADLKPGRVRYGVLSTDAGRIIDDGTIACLADSCFYVTTTSTGSEGVLEWFEWWNAVWRMDVEIFNVTGALAAVNVAGPRARELLGRLTSADVSADGFKYLDARQAHVAGVACLLLRIGFVGELGYELHFPSVYGEYVWDTLLERGADLGAKPFGLEAQRILRLEKQHIIVGQDTDSESNALSANMPWIVKFDKDDFVGKWALGHVAERGDRERLVGFEMVNGVVPLEGGQIVVDGRPAGRVTSARRSAKLGTSIGLAWVPPELAEEDSQFEIRVDGRLEPARVRLRPFFDPDGERLRA